MTISYQTHLCGVVGEYNCIHPDSRQIRVRNQSHHTTEPAAMYFRGFPFRIILPKCFAEGLGSDTTLMVSLVRIASTTTSGEQEKKKNHTHVCMMPTSSRTHKNQAHVFHNNISTRTMKTNTQQPPPLFFFSCTIAPRQRLVFRLHTTTLLFVFRRIIRTSFES